MRTNVIFRHPVLLHRMRPNHARHSEPSHPPLEIPPRKWAAGRIEWRYGQHCYSICDLACFSLFADGVASLDRPKLDRFGGS